MNNGNLSNKNDCIILFLFLLINVLKCHQPTKSDYPKSQHKKDETYFLPFQLDWSRCFPWYHSIVQKEHVFCFGI